MDKKDTVLDMLRANATPKIEGNPREVFKNHRERGPSVHKYTAQELADYLGLSLKTIYNQADQWQGSIERTVEYIAKKKGWI